MGREGRRAGLAQGQQRKHDWREARRAAHAWPVRFGTCLRLEAHLRRERRAALQLHLGANVFRGAGHNGAGQAGSASGRQHLPEGELALGGGVLCRVGPRGWADEEGEW